MQLVSRKPVEAELHRMGPLAKLPVFLDLAGKRVVVAGGSPMAAWKVELVAAAGANVEVYASELSPEMEQLAARGAAAGTVVHFPHAWSADVLPGAALAMADARDDVEAQAFWDAARAAGVPVNVIDKPAFCQFQFGTIVNRSPVVIGISTDGAAPILGQAIRRRVETLLPASLAAWGTFAKSMRRTILGRIESRNQRRAIWERLADRAFGPAPTKDDHVTLNELIDEAGTGTSETNGRVTLVGAGPGDAELLTLKAVRALQSADVILFDDLVSQEVLELARREAKRMLVGKRGKRESCSQADINALMVKLARQGKHVVRLKSGDPMIFGRAGEEIEELGSHGIPVDVVPGITAALAAAATLGVSLTHRDHAHSVRFVTGHSRKGELPGDLDWRGLADPQTTLMFYMGGRTAPSIAGNLIAAGLAATTPVVAIAGVSRREETRWHGDLEALSSGRCALPREQPILIGIGRAFASAKTNAMQAPSSRDRASGFDEASERCTATA